MYSNTLTNAFSITDMAVTSPTCFAYSLPIDADCEQLVAASGYVCSAATRARISSHAHGVWWNSSTGWTNEKIAKRLLCWSGRCYCRRLSIATLWKRLSQVLNWRLYHLAFFVFTFYWRKLGAIGDCEWLCMQHGSPCSHFSTRSWRVLKCVHGQNQRKDREATFAVIR